MIKLRRNRKQQANRVETETGKDGSWFAMWFGSDSGFFGDAKNEAEGKRKARKHKRILLKEGGQMKRATYITTICLQCGGKFYQKETGREPKYCSSSCRQSAYRDRVMLKRSAMTASRARQLLMEFRNEGAGQGSDA